MFLKLSKSQPVFPPTAASTMGKRVVGTNSSFAYSLKVEEAKDVMSQITPPPMPTKTLERCKPDSNAVCMMNNTFSMVLWLSPAPRINRVLLPFLKTEREAIPTERDSEEIKNSFARGFREGREMMVESVTKILFSPSLGERKRIKESSSWEV